MRRRRRVGTLTRAGVADLDAFLIPLGVAFSSVGESGFGGGRGDQFDDGAVGGEWPAAPVHCDVREHAVLDPVPFRGSGRVVTDSDLEAGLGLAAIRSSNFTLGFDHRVP